jgi:hypothetical protein
MYRVLHEWACQSYIHTVQPVERKESRKYIVRCAVEMDEKGYQISA